MPMDGDNMRRGNFFRRNQYKIAAVCLLAAVLGLTGMVMLRDGKKTEQEPEQQTVAEEPEKTETKQIALTDTETEEPIQKRQTTKASTVIKPKKDTTKTDTKTDTKNTVKPAEEAAEETDSETEIAEEIAKEPEVMTEPVEQPETVETAAPQPAAEVELHFNTDAGLLWPVEGSVILDYSMDQTVYFSTLDQYKYNPAVIISGSVNDKVKAAANGKITDISTNEVTGCTVTMDIGDGYTAIYGQLKEVPYEVGAYLESGNTIGFVSEPTKYYSLEGSNLYFSLEKDGAPVDPVEFFHE